MKAIAEYPGERPRFNPYDPQAASAVLRTVRNEDVMIGAGQRLNEGSFRNGRSYYGEQTGLIQNRHKIVFTTAPSGDSRIKSQDPYAEFISLFRRQEGSQPSRLKFDFLQSVIYLAKAGHIDSALDVLYDRVDAFLKQGNFADLDAVFNQTSAKPLSLDIILGLLTASLPAKSKLPARSRFYTEAEATVKQRGEWVEGLFAGLEP